MAHFARIDDNGLVIDVQKTDDSFVNEGLDWLVENFGGKWVKTSYNTVGGQHIAGGKPLRKNFAGIGYTYDENRDAFIPPKPFESWVLDEDTCIWVAPVPLPDNDHIWDWDETTVSFVMREQSQE